MLLHASFFGWSVQDWETRHGAARIVESDLDVLKEENLIPNPCQPPGFIFHMSRCGSTALSQALAQSPRNLVISEPDAVNGLLYPRYAPENCREGISTADRNIFVNLVLGLGRDQDPDRRFFIKFTSWNVLLESSLCPAARNSETDSGTGSIVATTTRFFVFGTPKS